MKHFASFIDPTIDNQWFSWWTKLVHEFCRTLIIDNQGFLCWCGMTHGCWHDMTCGWWHGMTHACWNGNLDDVAQHMDVYVAWHLFPLSPFISDQKFLLDQKNTSPIFSARLSMIDNFSWVNEIIFLFIQSNHQRSTIFLGELNSVMNFIELQHL